MAGQICQTCKHQNNPNCYCSPNSCCEKYEEFILPESQPQHLSYKDNCNHKWRYAESLTKYDRHGECSHIDIYQCELCGATIKYTFERTNTYE